MPAPLISQRKETPGKTQLKICGLRDAQQAGAIAAAGVDAIGVVAVPGSPRFLPVDQRPELFASVHRSRPACAGVLVVADPADRDLPDLLAGNGHQVLQLHGGETPQRCLELRRTLGQEIVLWKALRVRSREDLPLWEAYADVVDALLLDAWVPHQLGGTGRSIPLDWLEGFAPSLPWWLAGGISPETAPSVLEVLHPFGLDASSGVEDRPGVKNPERVNQLVHALRAADEAGPAGPAKV
ncbi:MAG: phosphoribosylanthranilate isomerase [Cyanobium sp.]